MGPHRNEVHRCRMAFSEALPHVQVPGSARQHCTLSGRLLLAWTSLPRALNQEVLQWIYDGAPEVIFERQ